VYPSASSQPSDLLSILRTIAFDQFYCFSIISRTFQEIKTQYVKNT
jgi:hypothetical protein